MLNKVEISVMQCLYKLCKKKNDSCIVTNKFIVQSVPEKFNLKETDIDGIFKQLEYDGYIDYTVSDRNEEVVSVVSLKAKGKAFQREMLQRKRELFNTILWRVIFGGLGALAGFIVTRIMSSI